MTTERFRRRYAGKDRATLIANVKSSLRSRFAEKGISIDFSNDLVAIIIEQCALIAENSNFFQDVQANEAFLPTVQSRNALDRHVSSMGYNPAGAVPSGGSISVGLSEPNANAVIVPKGFEWNGPNGLVFQTTQDYVFPANDTTKQEVGLTQQEGRSTTFASNGLRFQRFPLAIGEGEFLSYRSVVVEINGETWTESDSFLDTDTSVFRVAYTAEPPFIQFGDGAVGDIPPSGAGISVEYNITRGPEGVIEGGQITSPVSPLNFLGSVVNFVVDESTGEMKGGSGPEDSSLTIARAPIARLADDAIVTRLDFQGLVESFKDPIFGAPGAVSASLATSVQNDAFTYSRLVSIRSKLTSNTDLLQSKTTDVSSEVVSTQAGLSFVSNGLEDVFESLVAGSDALNALDEIDVQSSLLRDGIVSIEDESSTVSSRLDGVDSDRNSVEVAASDLRALIQGVGSGGTISPTDYQAMIDALDAVDNGVSSIESALSFSSPIRQGLSAVSTSTLSLKSQLSNVRSEQEKVVNALSVVSSDVTDLNGEVASISSGLSAFNVFMADLNSGFVNPFGSTVDDINDIIDHLDRVFADVCGPNLISVNVLGLDADGFYTAPTTGLLDSLQTYIDFRKEESVVYKTQSAENYIITPLIEVVFKERAGVDPLKIRASVEDSILASSKGRDFGAGLNIDDLYNDLRDLEDDLDRVNIRITGFTGSELLSCFIDQDGNLSIQQREVVSKPQISFFRVTPNGSRESI